MTATVESTIGATIVATTGATIGAGCRAPLRSDRPERPERSGEPAATSVGTSPAPPLDEARSIAAQPIGQPAIPGTRPLSLRLSLAEEKTGGEFRLVVPMLRLDVRNSGAAELVVPRPGVDLILSLRVHLARESKEPESKEKDEKEEVRHVRSFLSWPIATEPLPPGAELVQLLSPLSREQKDAPLAPGRYRTRVCVIPHAEAHYPSSFTERFGGSCTNPVELSVTRR